MTAQDVAVVISELKKADELYKTGDVPYCAIEELDSLLERTNADLLESQAKALIDKTRTIQNDHDLRRSDISRIQSLESRALAAEPRLAEAMRVIERANGLLGDAIICVRPFDPSKADAMLQAQDAARDFLNAAKEKT